MKKGILKSILFSLAGLAIFATSVIYLNKDNNAIKLKADEEINITISDIHDYLSTKQEHYPISDLFINEYQQTSGGYIAYARQLGMTVDKSQALPNQKWHFFNSWLYRSIDDGSLSWNDSAKSRVYSKLLCPELLLWIYEACNVDTAKVQAAYDVAVQGKIDGVSTTTIAKNMRSQVSWEDMKEDIENYISHSTAPHYVSCTSGAGYTVSAFDINGYTRNTKVTFTVSVTDDTKQINIVDSSSASILNPSEGVYEFYMPNRDVEIEITLRDKDHSDLLFAAVDLDFPAKDQTKVNSYTSSFTCSSRNYPITIEKASNYNNGWDYIKIGNKADPQTAKIKNTSPIVEAIEGIKIDFGAYNSAGVNRVFLQISNDSEFETFDEINIKPYIDGYVPGEIYLPIDQNYQGNNKYYCINFETNTTPTSSGFVTINRIRFLTAALNVVQSIAVSGNLPSFSAGTEFEFDNDIVAHFSISGDRVVSTNITFNINYEPIKEGDFIPYSSAGNNVPFEIIYISDDGDQVSASYKINIASATVDAFTWDNAEDLITYYGKTISDNCSSWVFNATWSTSYVEHPTIGEGMDDVHVALYDTNNPAAEKTPLPMNYKFTKADNSKYLVAFYHDVKASDSVQVSTYRLVYKEVTDGTIIYDFSSVTGTSTSQMSLNVFNSYYDDSSTIEIGGTSIGYVYKGGDGQIKMGTTNNQSEIRFVLDEKMVISSATIRAKWASSTENCIEIMGKQVTLKEEFDDYTVTLSNDDFDKTNVFTLNTLSDKKRAYVHSINIVVGYMNISQSSDCVAIENFITDYMHMEDYTENLGWCKDQEHHYYDSARTAFNNLTLEQRTLFMTNEAYADEKDRLSAWAEANTSGFDNENKVLLARNKLVREDKSNYIVLIGLILAVGGTITAFVLVNKSKRNEKGL